MRIKIKVRVYCPRKVRTVKFSRPLKLGMKGFTCLPKHDRGQNVYVNQSRLDDKLRPLIIDSFKYFEITPLQEMKNIVVLAKNVFSHNASV